MAIPTVAPSSRVAALYNKEKIEEVDEFGFGKAEEKVVWACHEFIALGSSCE
jgi:hypothetical protein